MLYRWDCTTWRIKPENAKSMLDTASSDYAAVARVYFVQYHLHLQLLSASPPPGNFWTPLIFNDK